MSNVSYEDHDGAIPGCVLIANGRRFDAWYVYDLPLRWWGEHADLFREDLRPDAKTIEVEFPDGERRQYVDLAGAKRAIERSAR